MEREDGEMSDDNAMAVDDTLPDANYTLLYKTGKNGIKIEKLEKVDAMKIEERAKRFGLNLTGNQVVTQKQIDELYKNFGIDSENERHFRFDTLHMNGVDGLTTREIFEYLSEYKPVSLEWIDDNSCNIVCQDHIATALALLVHSREIHNKELKQLLSSSTHHWREGMPHEKKDLILMRFATNSDKKEPHKKPEPKPTRARPHIDQSMEAVGKNPWGDLCQSWGVYDHQEILNHRIKYIDNEEDDITEKPVRVKNQSLAKRLGKRRQMSDDNESDSDNSSIEWKSQSKAPRMRMRADDEESKIKKRKTNYDSQQNIEDDNIAHLSIEVANTDLHYRPKELTKLSDKFKSRANHHIVAQPQKIHSRLGIKVAPQRASTDDDWTSDDSSVKSDHNIMSRVQKIGKPRSSSASDVWSRLEVNNSTKSTSDLRQILKTKSNTSRNQNDLRSRLKGAKSGVSLRIEIDNVDYHSSD